MKLQTFFAASLTLALAITSRAQPLDKAKLDQLFDRLAEKNKAMGCLTIARNGEVLYTRAIGYGQINGAEKKPLNASSRFRIGSITKMFTTAMIFRLIEDGMLKPTDTLERFFPQIPNANKITLAHILAHRSGIPNVRREQRDASTTPITKDEMLALISKATPDFEPGTKHSYSNSGYFLLGLILEKRTGKSYADVLEDKITSKLGLKDTYVATGNIDVSKNESLTYIYTGTDWKQVPETHPSILFGAGSIVSTPNDMAKFIQALFDGKIVAPESLAQMKSIRDGDGLGVEPFTFAGKTFYGHTGGADNYGAWLAYHPEERLAVAYATNAKVHPVAEIVRGVVDIYYHRPFEIPAFATMVVSPAILDQYVGVYSSPGLPVKFTITREGTTLFVRPGDQSAAPLEATTENTFQLLGGRIVFEFDPAKKQMIHRRGGPERVFTKEN